MDPRRPQMELRAREPFVLGQGSYLATGQRLTVTEGTGLAELLAPEAQVSRFGRIVFDVIPDPDAGTCAHAQRSAPPADPRRPPRETIDA